MWVCLLGGLGFGGLGLLGGRGTGEGLWACLFGSVDGLGFNRGLSGQ